MLCIRVWHLLPAFKVNINLTGKLKRGRKKISIGNMVSALKYINFWPLVYFSVGHVAFWCECRGLMGFVS